MAVTPDDKRLLYVPLDEIKNPKEGYEVMLNRWWCFLPGRGVMFYTTGAASYVPAPQCNHNRECAEAIRKKLYPFADLIFIPLAFVKRD